jgi:hypothetical protein
MSALEMNIVMAQKLKVKYAFMFLTVIQDPLLSLGPEIRMPAFWCIRIRCIMTKICKIYQFCSKRLPTVLSIVQYRYPTVGEAYRR